MNTVKTVFLNPSLFGVIAIVAFAQVLFATLVIGADQVVSGYLAALGFEND